MSLYHPEYLLHHCGSSLGVIAVFLLVVGMILTEILTHPHLDVVLWGEPYHLLVHLHVPYLLVDS